MYAALILGLSGSLHCMGMCGPLLLAANPGGSGRWQAISGTMMYHSGRILVYAAMGVFFGLIGKGFSLAGLQQSVSVIAGVAMVGMAVLAWRIEALTNTFPLLQRLTGTVHRCYGQLFGKGDLVAAAGMGMLNGLLPCGMVYAALAGAISTTNGWEGGAFMAVFGAGTLPLLLTVTLLGRKTGMSIRQKIGFLQPALMAIAGILLIQRGLHLDLSLFDGAVPKATLDCH